MIRAYLRTSSWPLVSIRVYGLGFGVLGLGFRVTKHAHGPDSIGVRGYLPCLTKFVSFAVQTGV